MNFSNYSREELEGHFKDLIEKYNTLVADFNNLRNEYFNVAKQGEKVHKQLIKSYSKEVEREWLDMGVTIPEAEKVVSMLKANMDKAGKDGQT